MRTDALSEALAIVLDALADRLAARITAAPDRERYSSHSLPPCCSRRRFAEVCRSGRVADARREGRDWICSRASWEAARRRPAAVATPERLPGSGPLVDQADRLLARSGLRVVGGRRR
jgi:hypothetical protein